jgi:hypothetical protein
MLVAIFHIVAVVPLFLYVGFSRAATVDWVYTLMFALGIIILGYHSFKAILKYMNKSMGIWVNLIHIFIIAPLILWIGYNGKKTMRPFYEMLLMVGFAALGYHLYNLAVMSQTFVKA